MDIYSALHSDHERMRTLLARLERATALDQDTSQILAGLHRLLLPHARAEEELLYNSIRLADPDNDVVMHGFREHMEAETLLRALQGMKLFGVEWTAAARKLRENIEHHIEEEETKIFPAAKKLFDLSEANQLGDAFIALKPEIREEGMVGNALHMVRNLLPPRLRGAQENLVTGNRKSA